MNKELRDHFFGRIELYFSFLKNNYGFELIGSREWSLCAEISFKNNTTGVVLIYDFREGVNGYIVKLDKGELGTYELDRWFRIIRLKNLNKKENKIIEGNFFNRHTENYIDHALKLLSEILESEGDKVLKGDFSQFEQLKIKLKNIVEKRNKSNKWEW